MQPTPPTEPDESGRPSRQGPKYDQALKRLLTRAHDGLLALIAPGLIWQGERSPELPAVVRQGPVVVAVSTSGYSPALAGWIREKVAEQLGPEVALLAEWLSEAREEMKAGGRSTEDVDWRTALDSDMLELIRTGQVALARERLQACLSS